MTNIEYDISKTKDVLDGKLVLDSFRKVFFTSNENLPMIFKNVDFTDKNVLSVVGSGDQMFHSYASGAKHVDVFDKNKLTFYYLYLRVWVIEYLDKFYPSKKINCEYIKKLIDLVDVKTEDENMALEYWKMFVDKYPYFSNSLLFLPSKIGYKYNYLKDLSLIKDKIETRDFKFYNVDIQRDIDINKIYDIIIVSNIVDCVAYMEEYRENLDRLLADDGLILASNVSYCNPTEFEKAIFSEKFDMEKIPRNFQYSCGYPAYLYKKKMLTKNS